MARNARNGSNVLVLRLERVSTVLDDMLVVTDERDALRALDWLNFEDRVHRLLRLHYGVGGYRLVQAADQSAARQSLEKYFAGDVRAIDEISVETGGTPFQREVWSALRKIPAGKTTSYGLLATEIDRPNAIRAVGMANGSNPVGIVVPCHRVIGKDSSLTGYGGGLERKRWLLEHEGVLLPTRSAAP
ncbi:methylated-DNA-[protein]-cysteine S-methyltransferase [Bradyrhizobium algeriense]|uniref:Methylated-DNA-[protein]-cysteine S-methyltransferase n=1 Tax=Bradyrhizobium algeriense TaxID=634784 RepID=A0ABU8BNK4_9BRAD